MCLSAAARVFIAASLLIRFRDDRGNGYVAPTPIHGNEREICGADVLALVKKIVFHPDFYSHFHRSIEDADDRRTNIHQFSDMVRSLKMERTCVNRLKAVS